MYEEYTISLPVDFVIHREKLINESSKAQLNIYPTSVLPVRPTFLPLLFMFKNTAICKHTLMALQMSFSRSVSSQFDSLHSAAFFEFLVLSCSLLYLPSSFWVVFLDNDA